MHPTRVALALVCAVVVVGATVTAGATGATGVTTERQTVQAQDERLDNGTALVEGAAGKFVSGRENDEDQVTPGNFTFSVKNHEPGGSSGFVLYASGFQESFGLHWNILYQPDFDWSSCDASNAAAYGLDRGNDDSGTATDVSLLSAAKVLLFRDDGIYTGYYKEDKLAGGPITSNKEDQVVAGLNGCQQNPSEPGWYATYARSNGSSMMDTQTDYAVAVRDYAYICEGCDSRQDAIEKLGPEPTACPAPNSMPPGTTGITDKEWTCRTADGQYFEPGEDPSSGGGGTPDPGGGTPTPGGETPTPGGETPTTTTGGAAQSTPTATPTPTAADPATPTATPAPTDRETQQQNQQTQQQNQQTQQQNQQTQQQNQQTQQQNQQQTQQNQQQTQQNQQQNQQTQQQNQQASGPVTPTAGAGPGFGLVAALAGLLAVALLVLRRD